jgi:hypothetical protein
MSGIHRRRPAPIEDADLQTGEAIFTTAGVPHAVLAAFVSTSAQRRLPEGLEALAGASCGTSSPARRAATRSTTPKRSAMTCRRLAWRGDGSGALWPHTAGGGTTCRGSVVAGNTPPPGGPNASSRARAGGEGRFRVRHCSADNSRITLSTYRLARGRRVHSSAVSSREAAR